MRDARWWIDAFVATLLLFVAACSDMEPPPTTGAAADSADQRVFGLVHYITLDGVRRVRLEADTAYFYQTQQSAELYGVRGTFYSPSGAETWDLTSREGTYAWRTGDMEARGNVVAVTPDGRRLTTSVLSYERRSDQIVGAQPFVFVAPERRVEGDAFTSDPDFRNLVATRPRGTVGRVPIDR